MYDPLGDPERPFALLDGLDAPATALAGGIVAIGNFDGVHRGHQAVLGEAVERGRASGRPVSAMTFEPHPRSFFRPEAPVFRLTPAGAKARLMRALGLDGVVVMPFGAALAGMAAEAFVDRYLIERMRLDEAVVGYDFHFGRARGGSPEFLAAQGGAKGFKVDVVQAFRDEGDEAVSSSRIRAALEVGELGLANGLLGYRWFVEGRVVGGDRRGRDLGFPTANMRLPGDCRLKHGVYAVQFTVDGVKHPGVANYGRRPQFDNGPPLLETYVIDFSGDLYGRDAIVTFVSYLRAEARFESVQALIDQMALDTAEARAVLGSIGPGSPLDLALDQLG